ncbi:MAG: hypothetical protein HRU17_03060 [Polyangiaceae bacterium]|nr:hypothetical protein [Polyangiaceae bacterium]
MSTGGTPIDSGWTPEIGSPDTGADGSDTTESDSGILPADGFLHCGADWCPVGTGEVCCAYGSTTECADSARECDVSLACHGPKDCGGSRKCCGVGFNNLAVVATECGCCNVAATFECSGRHNRPGSEVCCDGLAEFYGYLNYGVTHSQCKTSWDPSPIAEIRLCRDRDDCDSQPSTSVSGFMVWD